MRILFMGTGGFAVPSLKALLASQHEVIGVVTQPDRPAGRGRQLRVSPIKQIAVEACITVYQPEKVRSEDFVALVRDLSPDAIVVASFGQIIPKSVLEIPKFGNINVHSSLLPKYRGAAPIHYALFKGEERTGVTTMLMNVGLDTGPILLQAELEILPDEDEASLEARLAEIGAELLLTTLSEVESGSVVPKEQDDSLASYAPSVKREECMIDWQSDARTIVNRVRGCSPRPGAYTFWQGSVVKVWSASVSEDQNGEKKSGEVVRVTDEGIIVKAGNGTVLLRIIQPENKKRMQAAEFARGYRVSIGSNFNMA